MLLLKNVFFENFFRNWSHGSPVVRLFVHDTSLSLSLSCSLSLSLALSLSLTKTSKTLSLSLFHKHSPTKNVFDSLTKSGVKMAC